jgi:NDP-sugar pyrophosphorylase family protein
MSMLPVAVLAGGKATRLGRLTLQRPKSLLRVAGHPFIHWQLNLLAQQGVTDAVLCVGHFADQIRDAVGDGRDFGVAVRYSCDGDTLRGTGGALKHALPLLGRAFFVLYGDSYLPCSFAAAQAGYEASGAAALMTVVRNQDRWVRSNVVYREGRIIEYNKRAPRWPDMAYIDFGLGVLSAHVVQRYRAGAAFDLADLYHELSLRSELAALEVTGRFYEIGSVQGIAATERYLANDHRAADELRRTVPAGSR